MNELANSEIHLNSQIADAQLLVGQLQDILSLGDVYQQDDTVFQNKIKASQDSCEDILLIVD